MTTALTTAGVLYDFAMLAISQAKHHTLQHDLVCMQALARYVLPEGSPRHHAAGNQK